MESFELGLFAKGINDMHLLSVPSTILDMTATIDLIHAAAREGSHPKLAEAVLIAELALQHLLSAVTSTGSWHYIDVPVMAPVGVGNAQRINLSPPFTWGQAALGLDGDGWGPRALQYLEEPLRVEPMPDAPGAKWALKLTSYAGAVFCHNGTHRLAAGIAWLQRPGASGVLHLAATHVMPERNCRVGAIVELAELGQVEFAHITAPAHIVQLAQRMGSQCDLVARAGKEGNETYVGFPNAGGAPIWRHPEPLHRRLFSSKGDKLPYDWQVLPPEVLLAWRNRGWVDASVAAGEYVGKDEPEGEMLARF